MSKKRPKKRGLGRQNLSRANEPRKNRAKSSPEKARNKPRPSTDTLADLLWQFNLRIHNVKRVRFGSYLRRCPDQTKVSQLLSELIRCELRHRAWDEKLLKGRLRLFARYERSEAETLSLLRGIYGDRVHAGQYPTISEFENLGYSLERLQLKTDEEALYLGQTIADQYRIEQRLGKGSYGIVYRGTNLRTNRPIAVKTSIITGDEREQLAADSLKQEANLLATLHGVGIPRRIEFVEFTPGRRALIREFVEGITLYQLIQQGPCDPTRAARLVAGLAQTLQFLHRRGFLHRDLSPSNILVDKDDTPFLTDFGLGVLQAELFELARHTAGTHRYMSVASRLGATKDIDERDDIYALGVICYELLSGRTAPESTTGGLWDRGREFAKGFSEFCANAPPQLIAVCQCCIADDPDDRYETASLLARELVNCPAIIDLHDPGRFSSLVYLSSKEQVEFALRRILAFRVGYWVGIAGRVQNHAEQRLQYLVARGFGKAEALNSESQSNECEQIFKVMMDDIQRSLKYLRRCNWFVRKLGWRSLPAHGVTIDPELDISSTESRPKALRSVTGVLANLDKYVLHVMSNLDRRFREESASLSNIERLGTLIGGEFRGPALYELLTSCASKANLPPGCIDHYINRATADLTSSEHETDGAWARKTVERQLRNDLADELDGRHVVERSPATSVSTSEWFDWTDFHPTGEI